MAGLKEAILSRFVDIVKCEYTYFVSIKIPDAKINKDIVRLNYSYLSPFKESEILFLKEKDILYLWFVKSDKVNDKSIIYIPEGFLLFRRFNKNNDAIIINKIKSGVCIIVVKDGFLVAQFVKNSVDEKIVDMLKREYSLENVKVINVSYSIDFDWLSLEDIFRFLSYLDFNATSVVRYIYEQLKAPAIIFLLLINIYSFLMYRYIYSSINAKTIELKELRNKNRDIKEKFNYLEKESKFFKQFYNSELKYPSVYSTLLSVSKSVSLSNGKISMYRQFRDTINMLVKASSTSAIVSNIVKTKMFDDVNVVSVSQDSKDKTKEIGELQLKLKSGRNER